MSKPGRKRKPPPVSLPGQQGRMVELVEVDDPYEAGKKIRALKNTMASPLDHLYARGRLVGPDDSDADGLARKIAGDWVRIAYERSEMSDARAIDYAQVRVDVSFQYSGLSESKAEALQILKRMSDYLGRRLYHVVYSICGREISVDDLIRQDNPNREPGRMDRLGAYQDLRDGLDMVIQFRGASSGTGWKIRSERMFEAE